MLAMGHFTVVCLDTWPLNESEAAVDLVLIETSLLCYGNELVQLISIQLSGFYQNKVNTSLIFIPGKSNYFIIGN